MCHQAGQGKSAQSLLRYQAGDWNALHRDVFGDLVFPLQVHSRGEARPSARPRNASGTLHS